MDDPKKHVIETLKEGTNILVTVKKDPTIDQLAACIALTIALNDLDKHGTAVFSGEVPSVLDFLEPERTIERNTDSLQDFIISLDKAKADKLRYKIEDTMVKIFITPYRTSLSADDLNFEPGDFNVDVVVALGVHNQDDLDDAITAHGRILHDATVLSINTEGGASQDLGSISWIDESASSLSEMVANIAGQLGKEDIIDNQIATALLTGIVAETERFGNNRTKPATMEVAAKLLTAGANQELVATKLAAPVVPAEAIPAMDAMPEIAVENTADDDNDQDGLPPARPQDDGSSLSIHHSPRDDEPRAEATNVPAVVTAPAQDQVFDNVSQLLATDGQAQPLAAPLDQAPQDIFAATDPAGMPDPAAASDGLPPIIRHADNAADPLTATGQGIEPSFQQPPLAASETAASPQVTDASQAAVSGDALPAVPVNAAGDEQAAMDFLRSHKVADRPRSIVEPLPSQLAEARIAPLHQDAVLPELKDGQTADDMKFGAQRPAMGGTLTANVPNERRATMIGRDAARRADQAPLLSHGAPQGSASRLPAAAPAPASPAAPTVALPQVGAASAPADVSLIEPAMQQVVSPSPTLADLEKQVHSAHQERADEESQAAAAAGADDNAGLNQPLFNMEPAPQATPAPSASVALPTPVAPTAQQPAAPLASPPPVPPPVPSMAA